MKDLRADKKERAPEVSFGELLLFSKNRMKQTESQEMQIGFHSYSRDTSNKYHGSSSFQSAQSGDDLHKLGWIQ